MIEKEKILVDRAIDLLRTVDWVGSEAKARIEEVIELLLECNPDYIPKLFIETENFKKEETIPKFDVEFELPAWYKREMAISRKIAEGIPEKTDRRDN